MFLMRPYFPPPRYYLGKNSRAALLTVALLGVMSVSYAYAANSDVIVQPLGTSHGNSDVLVMPSPNTFPDHSNEPEEKAAQPDLTPAGSSQTFSSLIDILQNKPKIEATAPEATVPEPPAQDPPAPVVRPPEPVPAPQAKLPNDRGQQPTTLTPRLPPVSPKDLLPVPYNSGSGPK